MRPIAPALPLIAAACLLSACGDTGKTTASNADPLFQAGPFTIAPGGDDTWCSYFRAATDTAFDVSSLHGEQTQGGHHLIVYFVNHPINLAPHPCPQGGQPGWNQVFASQNEVEDVTFPEGVGFHIKAGQQVVLETHFINATQSPITAHSRLSMHLAPTGSVKIIAAPYFIGSVNISVPPGQKSTIDTACKLEQATSLYSATGHEHRYGTGVRLAASQNAAPEQMLYQTTQWDSPPTTRFASTIDLKKGDTVHVTCDWNNTSTTHLGYPHEMCFAAGIYWPADRGTLFCLAGGGDPGCQCYYENGNTDAGPGGGTIKAIITRKDMLANVKGDPSITHHLYCSLWNPDDYGPLFPNATAVPRYTNDVDATLTTPNDTAEVLFNDVTPGDYRTLCYLDTIYGGFFPGTGDPVSIASPMVTAVKAQTVTVNVKLDLAAPMF